MMTIEERARRYSNKLVSENSYNGYIAGATEQKVIDEKLMAKLKESWEKESEINHDAAAHYKQGWHDAVKWACEWLKEYTTRVRKTNLGHGVCEFQLMHPLQVDVMLTALRKFMEESK